MCRMLYIASNAVLPLLPWDEDHPGFHVTELGENEKTVAAKFRNTHVYYAGPYEGCGCGFQAGECPGYEDEDIDLKTNSLNGLAKYIDDQLINGSEIELFGCWDGDQSKSIEHTRTIFTEFFRKNNFWFKDREHLIVKPNSWYQV